MRRAISWLLAGLAVLAAIIVLGPRVPADTNLRFDASSIGSDPEAYFAAAEAKVAGVRPGQQKQIVWARPDHTRTPIVIVYVHGFSASSGEVRPLPDMVAKMLDANLVFTRLTGHGRDGAAMAEGSVNAWVNDYAEALAVARAIGDRIYVIATSTGGSLAVVNALDSQMSANVVGLALISPNFGIQAGGSFLLTMPWGKQLAEMIIGKERSFEPVNEKQAALWTTRYPTVALLPMAKLVELANAIRVEDVTIPALFIFSEADKVVRPDRTKEIAERWGGPHEIAVIETSGDPSMHVLAGDALSPQTTDGMAKRIADWITLTIARP